MKQFQSNITMKVQETKDLIFCLLFLIAQSAFAKSDALLSSPNGKISVTSDNGTFKVYYDKNLKVLTLSDFGFSTNDIVSVSKVTQINEHYKMLTGKRLNIKNKANEITLNVRDANYGTKQIIFRAYNDGIAFRTSNKDYVRVEVNCENKWLMRYSDGYEDFYPLNPEEKAGAHWGFPALFEIQDARNRSSEGVFVLMTEADINKGNSGASLYSESQPNTYRINHPEDENPVSPWRIAIIGNLADIVESTLVTDVSTPCKIEDTSWIHPGVVSWVYWAYNHGSNDYNIIKMYSDMARDLHLPYVLIDAEWDEMKDGKTMEDAVKYALSQGVKPLIWYNSSVGWINGAPGPKFRLNKPEDREKEFAYISSLGVAGVKVDFFAGDIQSTMDYHIDLMECAARHHLLINFHGATIPRGWQRTYPNLMTTEAVYGAEWYNNLPVLTNKAACHNATIPFTRGVIGSMDYTPCTFTDSQHPHITTDGHELALTVLYESGLLHLADRPSSYLSQPQAIKDFLSNLPTTWDDTKLLSGYPGKSIVMARRKGNDWYIAGINGKDEQTELTVKNGKSELSLPKALQNQLPASISVLPRGGFVGVYKNKHLQMIIVK